MDNMIRSVRPKTVNRNQRRFREEHESCVLCGTRLQIKAERLTDKMTVREIAECPQCQVRARSTEHPLL